MHQPKQSIPICLPTYRIFSSLFPTHMDKSSGPEISFGSLALSNWASWRAIRVLPTCIDKAGVEGKEAVRRELLAKPLFVPP